MRMKFYPDELKNEAIRLVVKHRLTTREAAQRLGLRGEIVRVWVRRFRGRMARPNDADQLRACVQKLAIERDTLAGIAARLLEKAG
jgi:transposase-like protein